MTASESNVTEQLTGNDTRVTSFCVQCLCQTIFCRDKTIISIVPHVFLSANSDYMSGSPQLFLIEIQWIMIPSIITFMHKLTF